MRFSLLVVALAAGCANQDQLDPGGMDDAATARAVCPDSPYSSLQAAIDDAVDGAVITVCDGTFTERVKVSGKRVTLASSGGAAVTVINANYAGPAVTVTSGGDLTLDGFTIQNGRNSADGGGVTCSESTVTLENNYISGNNATNGGGVAASGCTVSLVNNDLVGNKANSSGGGASFKGGSTGTLSLNGISGNTAGSKGGGVYISGTLTLDGNEISGNNGQFGGGLYNDGDSPMSGNLVSDNYSILDGAGAFVNLHDGEISSNVFSGNYAAGDGGGLYVNEGTANVHDNDFLFNETEDDAGGLRVKLAAVYVDDNYFEGNSVPDEGGGAKLSHKSAKSLSGNVFVNNHGGWHGGGLVLDESATVLSDSTFIGNDSQSGGGLYIQIGWAPVSVVDTTFQDNTASQMGGNVYIGRTGVYAVNYFTRVDIDGGAADKGGGLFAEEGDVRLKNTLFRYNNAWTAGGAVYLKDVTGTLTNTVSYSNTSKSGAGMYLEAGRALKVKNTSWYKNTGSSAIRRASGVTPTWQYNNMYGNTGRFSNMSDPGTGSGNNASYPGFTTASGGDFHLASGSALVNVGDPGIKDSDGTRSDIGLYGGPDRGL